MKYADLSIAGFGYLQEIVPFNGNILARIYCLPVHQNDSKQNEAIILNCLVKDSALKARLLGYSSHLENGSSIVVKFNVNYLETTGFQNCMMNDDPDHIINMSAKLTAIDKVYVDGIRCLEEPITNLKIANL